MQQEARKNMLIRREAIRTGRRGRRGGIGPGAIPVPVQYGGQMVKVAVEIKQTGPVNEKDDTVSES